jgi:hypothetical protein
MMKSYLTKENLYKWLPWITGVAILIAVVWRGPIAGRDTHDYLSDTIIRSPLTPVLFSVFKFLLGRYYGTGFIIFQTLAVLLAGFYFTNVLKRLAKTGQLLSAVMLLIAFSPLLTNQIGNWLFTEGLSYALFLISAGLLAQLLYRFDQRKLMLLAFIICVNILNRPHQRMG